MYSADIIPPPPLLAFFFFNDTATTEIYTLSLHDALPISAASFGMDTAELVERAKTGRVSSAFDERSEEHTSELQSPDHLVCRLLLEKKKRMRRQPLDQLRRLYRRRSRPPPSHRAARNSIH